MYLGTLESNRSKDLRMDLQITGIWVLQKGPISGTDGEPKLPHFLGTNILKNTYIVTQPFKGYEIRPFRGVPK